MGIKTTGDRQAPVPVCGFALRSAALRESGRYAWAGRGAPAWRKSSTLGTCPKAIPCWTGWDGIMGGGRGQLAGSSAPSVPPGDAVGSWPTGEGIGP